LPNNIQAGDTYTITLKTELYDERPQAGIDAGWDDDSYVRPWLDGSSLSADLMNLTSDYWWQLFNLGFQNVGSYRVINRSHSQLKNIVWRDCVKYGIDAGYLLYGKDLYGWNFSDDFYAIIMIRTDCQPILEHVHLQGASSATGVGLHAQTLVFLKNCSFGKVLPLYYGIRASTGIRGENVFVSTSNTYPITVESKKYGKQFGITIAGYNNQKDKFHQWYFEGEIYNVDEDATIDPPSGATTYIKMSPNSHCSSLYPLIHEEERYQSGTSETYTWKFYPSGWSSLTTSDIEVEAWFLEESSGTKRKYATANPSSVTNDTWNDLSITISPGQAGTVYFKIKLKKYELGAFIALDPKPNVS